MGRRQHRLQWLSTDVLAKYRCAVFTSSGDVQNVDGCRSCKLTEIWDGRKNKLGVCAHVYVCVSMCVCTFASGGLRICFSGSVKTFTTVIKVTCVIFTIPW